MRVRGQVQSSRNHEIHWINKPVVGGDHRKRTVAYPYLNRVPLLPQCGPGFEAPCRGRGELQPPLLRLPKCKFSDHQLHGTLGRQPGSPPTPAVQAAPAAAPAAAASVAAAVAAVAASVAVAAVVSAGGDAVAVAPLRP